MSKISKKLIEIPQKVEVEVKGQKIRVKGLLGELEYDFPEFVKIKREDGSLRVEVENIEDKFQKATQGTTIRLIENMIRGVTNFFEKRLQLIGVGFNAKVETKPRSELGSTTGGETTNKTISYKTAEITFLKQSGEWKAVEMAVY